MDHRNLHTIAVTEIVMFYCSLLTNQILILNFWEFLFLLLQSSPAPGNGSKSETNIIAAMQKYYLQIIMVKFISWLIIHAGLLIITTFLLFSPSSVHSLEFFITTHFKYLDDENRQKKNWNWFSLTKISTTNFKDCSAFLGSSPKADSSWKWKLMSIRQIKTTNMHNTHFCTSLNLNMI